MSALEAFPTDWTRGLVLMAHPDDPEYGTALAVNRWTREGKSIAYVLASRGEAGIAGLDPAHTGALRAEEQHRATGHVGVESLEFLGLPDGRIEYGLELRQMLAGAIRQHSPDLVITLNFGLAFGGVFRNQADHRAVGLAALDAVADAGNEWIFPDLPGEPWGGVQYVAVFADEHPTHRVDVTDADVAAATAALAEHRGYLERLSDEPVAEQARTQVLQALNPPTLVDPSLASESAGSVSFRLYR